MNKKIILIGKSCSGKTELLNKLKAKGLKTPVTCTTRPIRPTEIDGWHYYFKTIDEFKKLIAEDAFIEYDVFNDWYYGMQKDAYESCDVIISTPRGLKKLLEKIHRSELLIVFLDTSDVQRLVRSSYRQDDFTEIRRRFQADENDFAEFIKLEDWDLRIDVRIEDNFELLHKLFS